ncbi:hypothetical protein FB451DRAFT_1555422 [Mycena latifolia]|nr:hypothetical protein FB451DRAFT_1555422 [Mycena latifolia]
MLETQIARARTLKIHFYGCEEADSRPQLTIFRCLAKHSSLWGELSISLTSDLVPVLVTCRHRIPSLRRLWILWEQSESQRAVESMDAFHSAPSLVNAGICNEYRFIPISLPGHQLTRYDVDAPWKAHEEILKIAQNLVEARIMINFDTEPWPEQVDIIGLLHLRRLYVSLPETLRYLRTPALQEVAFRIYEDGSDPDLFSDIESFVVRSACNLRRVCFKGVPDTPTISDILHKAPSITELAILAYSRPGRVLNTQFQAANTLLSHLTTLNSTGGLTVAPQLCAIEFGCAGETSIDYALYLKMLEARWRAQNCAFQTATLLTESGLGPDPVTLDGLYSLREDGLDLLLLHGDKGAEVMGYWTYNSNWTC